MYQISRIFHQNIIHLCTRPSSSIIKCQLPFGWAASYYIVAHQQSGSPLATIRSTVATIRSTNQINCIFTWWWRHNYYQPIRMKHLNSPEPPEPSAAHRSSPSPPSYMYHITTVHLVSCYQYITYTYINVHKHISYLFYTLYSLFRCLIKLIIPNHRIVIQLFPHRSSHF